MKINEMKKGKRKNNKRGHENGKSYNLFPLLAFLPFSFPLAPTYFSYFTSFPRQSSASNVNLFYSAILRLKNNKLGT